MDVKACHRYLISRTARLVHARGQPLRRPSFENRSRFFRNVVRKIRDAVPGLHRHLAHERLRRHGLPLRLRRRSQDDPAKPDLAEPIELVRFLRDSGAPLVNITIGNPYFNPHVNRPFDLPGGGRAHAAGAPAGGRGALRRHRAPHPGGRARTWP